jgi:hypothetical protein
MENIQDLIDEKNFRFVEGSITDLDLLRDMFNHVDYVFHEAALPSVPRSIKDPLATNRVNITGTLNVLLAAKDAGVQKVLFASSSSVYGDTPTLPKKESMLLNPLSPYTVDPYYLTFKARELGYHSGVILAGRSVNDSMAKYVAEMAIKGINEAGRVIRGSKVMIMGLTVKENIPDTRESPVREMVKNLKDYGCEVYGYDPLLTKKEIEGFGVRISGIYKRRGAMSV